MDTELRDTSERHSDFYSPYRAAQIDESRGSPARQGVNYVIYVQTLCFCVL